jgi:hypothetical protein
MFSETIYKEAGVFDSEDGSQITAVEIDDY